MANQRAKLTLKIGDREVRYEAEREAVDAQLEHILWRLLKDAPEEVRIGGESAPSTAGEPPPAPAPEVTEADLLARLYVIAKGKRLRLRKLPERTADTLLLVLYGMRKLLGRKWVHAPGMTSAARASGARIDRADRLLAAYQDLIEGFGHRRAKRYRLTAAGREHCARLVESLVGPVEPVDDTPAAEAGAEVKAEPNTGASTPAEVASEDVIPKKVTARWDGELLTVSEAAERLGVDEAEVGRLRRSWQLLGLPGGDRKRRRFFYPTFQIDAGVQSIVPQARTATRIVGASRGSWGIAEWWRSVHSELGRRPLELIGTPDADAVVQAARAEFPGSGRWDTDDGGTAG